jgi:DNA-binding SARP family transcriptional activator/ABC-type transport system substrate-binding protein
VEFVVLGQVEARADGRALALGGPKQRAVLAMLLLDANRPVSRDQLIDGLWGESPPRTATHTLDDYVSKLRRVLGGRIERRAAGYVLNVEPGELDLERFERLLEAGLLARARSDAANASAVLADALALWRGRPLGGVEHEPFAEPEASRLEERRLLAVEERIDADLDLGHGPALVTELEQLVADHPFQERLVGQLMLALYRGGRQSAALEAYRAARRRFAGELGIEPGPQLGQLERQILEHDPALVAVPRRKDRSRRRRVRFRTAAAAAIVAVGVGGLVAAVRSSSKPAAAASPSAGLVRVDASSSAAKPVAPIAGSPSSIATGAGWLWVGDTTRDALLKVDPNTGTQNDFIPLSEQPGNIAVAKRSVWVASTSAPLLWEIDAATDATTKTIGLPGVASALAFADGALWVGDPAGEAVLRVAPESGDVVRRVMVGIQPSAIVAGAGKLWVSGFDAGSVVPVDPQSNTAGVPIQVGRGPDALAFLDGRLWVANRLDGTVSRVDPNSGVVEPTLATGSGPSGLSVADGSVWVSNEFSGTVSRIDATRGTAAPAIAVGGDPVAVAARGSSVWAATRPRLLHRGGTLVLLDMTRFRSIDPQIDNEAPPAEFLGLVNDTLVAYDHTSGPEGLQLVPDLALAIPQETDGGRSYSFTLRKERYSTGRKLEATDFVRSMERLFRIGSPGAETFDHVVGARACMAHPTRCRLASGVIADNATRTVTFRLSTPDPDFLYKLADGLVVPIPPGTPMHDIGARPIPGTGPYAIAAVGRHRIKFTRNRRFSEWSHFAQPDGNPDRIEFRFGKTPRREAAIVGHGGADWSGDLFAHIQKVAARDGARTHSNVFPTLAWIDINTHDPPFDDIRARRALNFAVDRGAVVRASGGASAAAPSCQTIPPGEPGYRPYCPYTFEPSPTGRWNGPDLRIARDLVTASGTRGETVTIWDRVDTGKAEAAVPILVRALRQLGYRPRVRVLSTKSFDRTTVAQRAAVDLMPVAFGPDYPSAAESYSLFLACGGASNWRQFCDPRLDAEARRAEALRLTDPTRSSLMWQRLDRQLTNRAVWVPLASPRIIDIVSKRLRDYQFSPVYHFLPAQAALR